MRQSTLQLPDGCVEHCWVLVQTSCPQQQQAGSIPTAASQAAQVLGESNDQAPAHGFEQRALAHSIPVKGRGGAGAGCICQSRRQRVLRTTRFCQLHQALGPRPMPSPPVAPAHQAVARAGCQAQVRVSQQLPIADS